MGFADAANTYTTLTVGDGLVSQIPSLLVSTAAGIVVTKGGMHGSTEATLVRQLGGVRPLVLAGGAAGVLALMPGLPMLPFMALAGISGAAAWMRWKAPEMPDEDAPPPPVPGAEPPISDTLRIDLISHRTRLRAAGDWRVARRHD